MKSHFRAWSLLAAMVLVALSVVGGVGSAHTKRFASSVTLSAIDASSSPATITGRVSSQVNSCLKRTIVITQLTSAGSQKIVTGKSNDKGRFALAGTLDDDTSPVRATATRKVLKNSARHVHVCRSVTSDSATPDVGSSVDLTHLPVGDGKYSTSPKSGYIYTCQTTFNGGGASTQGPWFNGDGTWDLTKKVTVDGSVNWTHVLSVSLNGNSRGVSGNNLPSHPTGTFPVASSDDAYQYDRNPNSISAQNVTFSLDANPTRLDSPQCVGGVVGYMLTGAYLFDGFDAGGRDAVAWEVQDDCDGHPQRTGVYHYHSLSSCAEGSSDGGHSDLMGYALDGFGIYGRYGTDGKLLTDDDLDACHGHTHEIEWDGQSVTMYHYHATYDFPYTVGCFRGDPIQVDAGG